MSSEFDFQRGPEVRDLNGARLLGGFLTEEAQAAMVGDVRAICVAAPLFQPTTRAGKAMTVRMTAAGRFGWVSDGKGYRYQAHHPDGSAWPPIPASLLAVWEAVSGSSQAPECCLVNFYGEGARMGMHQDHDEADLDQPVVSVSLRDEGLFRVGGTTRGGGTRSAWLRSGDVVVLGGPARLAYHGVDRIRFGSSGLLRRGGRLNLTLRVVT